MAKLKRADLAKQFSDVVIAEMANHNAAICSSNIAMEDVRRSIEALEKKLKDMLGLFSTREMDDHRDVCQKISKVEEKAESYNKKLVEHIAINIKELNEILISFQDMLKGYARFEDMLKISGEINAFILGLEKRIEGLSEKVSSGLTSMNNRLDAKLEETSFQMKNLKDSFYYMKADLEDRISIAVVDAKGVLRELQKVKKTAFIQEKKIENLYTLIERLKEGK